MGFFVTWIVIVAVIFFAIIGLAKFNNGIDDSWRQQIVEHGCGEYYLDQNHNRQWRWK